MPAIIFDLDNCLSSARAAGEDLFEPAFRAIRAANDGSIADEIVDRACADAWFHAFDEVARRHGFTQAMFEAGWNAFARLEVRQPMQGYPDLDLLPRLPATLFLVTSGFRRLQQSKIAALGIEDVFREVHIDVIDEPGRVGKRGLFARIIETHQLSPSEVLVVGDNPASEIEAGRSLGLRTVQILRPGVERGTNADHAIETLAELEPLLAGLGKSR